MKQLNIKYITQLIVVIAAYAITGKLGLMLPYVGSQVTLIWLPSGIAVFALLRGGYGFLPAIFIGAVLVNMWVGSIFLVASSIAVGNTLAPLLTFFLLKSSEFRVVLNRGKDVLAMALSASVGMLISATAGVYSLFSAGIVAQTQLSTSWFVWWAGDTVGIFLALPLLLAATNSALLQLWRRKIDYLSWCVLVSVLEIAIFLFVPNVVGQFSLLAIIVLPLVIWSGMLFGLAGSSIAVLGLSAIAVLATVNAIGPFYQFDVHQGTVLLWVFMSILTLVALIINVLQAERLIFEKALKSSETKLRAVVNGALDGIVTIDERGKIIEFNPAAERIFGYTRDQVINKSLEQVMIPPSVRLAHQKGHQHFINTGEKRMFDQRVELTAMRSGGTEFPVELTLTTLKDEGSSLVTGFIRDITERKRAEEEIRKLAFFEVLTGLPNRRLLLDRLQHAFAHSARSNHYGAVLFIDLDNFKALNDLRGHAAGDNLLIEVAERIRRSIRGEDTVSRLGGDEFVVLLEGLSLDENSALQQAKKVGEKILVNIRKPYHLGGLEHHSSSSIGICLFSGYQIDSDELLKRADTAMYQAKAAGRNTLRFFDPSMQVALESRVSLESELRYALSLNQLSLHYQIQVDIERRIFGVEALLRWNNPARGNISPAVFIPIAEVSGLIVPIGSWVIETACKQLKEWENTDYASHIMLAVNISIRQFRQPDLVQEVKDVLEKTGANPAKLKLELTESIVIDEVSNTVEKMQALRSLGLNFSIDDFGTGYSSLSYLKQLPLTQLKIDQSFVRDIAIDSSDAAIVKAIIAMSDALGFHVIAEGVETDTQFDMLHDYGCQLFQGYLFSKPVAAEEVDTILKANHLLFAEKTANIVTASKDI